MALATPPAVPAAVSNTLAANPNLKPALIVAATSSIRDGIMRKPMNPKKSVILGAGQYAYLMTIAPMLRAQLATLSGETTYSKLLADSIGLSGVLILADKAGLTNVGADDQGGFVNMGNSFLGNVAEGLELQVESQLVTYGLTMAGY